MDNKDSISIIGAGSWGTAIAKVLAENNPGITIYIYARGKSIVRLINETRVNSQYLPGIRLPVNVLATNNLKDSIIDSNVILLATPSKVVYETCLKIGKYLSNDSFFAYLSKGFCKVHNEIFTISDTIINAIPSLERRVVAIYGPSHAEEVSERFQTCLNVAGISEKSRKLFSKLLSCSYIECRETDDIKGVELGGALKNPAAIALGIISVMPHCGDNLSGALISEALKEILKLGKLFRVKEETLLDISGLGDLVTTSLSDLSRNRRFGKDIAKQIMETGKSVNFFDKIIMRFRPENVLEKMGERFSYLAEGAYAIEPIIELAEKAGISIPVYRSLYEVLLNKMNPELLIETVKNPDKFEEVFQKAKIQITKRKKGLEKTSGAFFKRIIIKNILDTFLNDDLKNQLFEFRNSFLEMAESGMIENNSEQYFDKEYEFFKQLNIHNYEKKAADICKLYVDDVCDKFNYFSFKFFVKYMKFINLKNVIFLRSYGKRLLGNNIKISGNFSNLKRITDTSHVVFISTYRSYLDFAYLGMAIDRYKFHVPRFFIDKQIVKGKFKQFFLRLLGGYIIDPKKFNNPIYRVVVETYLATLIEHGVQILFFPELGVSKNGEIGAINQEFLSMIMKSLLKNGEEIALIPVEVSHYIKPTVYDFTNGHKPLTLKNILDNRVKVNFSDPIMTSDYANTNNSVTSLAELIDLKWKEDSYNFPHYIFCKIIRENDYQLDLDKARKNVEQFLQKSNLGKTYKARNILKSGIEFIESNKIGQNIDGKLVINRNDDIDYYSNLVYHY